MPDKYKAIEFPQDESSHNNIIEWWYINGNLRDEKGSRYAFMNCLFKADIKKVKIPFLNRVPLKNIYFFHSTLCDVKTKKNYSIIDYIVLVSKDSFKEPLLFFDLKSSLSEGINSKRFLKETEKFSYHLKNSNLNLKLVSLKKPLLESGKGLIDVCGKQSYYYSLTSLNTEGEIFLKNKEIKVKGKSWMDHQWANVSYSKDKWSWFSIQLNNDIELMCCEYDDGQNKNYLADIIYPNGKQQSLKNIKIIPGDDVWKSKKTKAKYPLNWKIEIPEKKINLSIRATLNNQEVIFGSINYWEGPTDVSGSINGEKVKGEGFMELVGYASDYDEADYVKEELEKAVGRFYASSKRKISNAIERLR